MTEERKCASEKITPIEESLALPSTIQTWKNESDATNDRSLPSKLNSSWKLHWGLNSEDRSASATQRLKNKVTAILRNTRGRIVPIIEAVPSWKNQLFALFLIVSCGIVPLAVLGHSTRGWSTQLDKDMVPFAEIWHDKTLSCGGDFTGRPQNSTIAGIEKIFVLDKTFGKFSFSQVKTIDVVWDVFVGRGVQICAWWAAYVVFSDALLRVIERQPVSFRIFQRIASEGPSLLSVWTLTKEVWAAKSKRTQALFFYIFLSTIYVLCIPLLLSAMTGYDSTTISWISLDDDNNKIVPSSALKVSWVIFGVRNETFDHPICKPIKELNDLGEPRYNQRRFCDCQYPDGTIFMADPTTYRYPENCTYHYPGNTQTYTKPYSNGEIGYCNATLDVVINSRTYDISNVSGTSGYCYNSVGYSTTTLWDKSRCLPDTANPSYQWGFSTILSALFTILQFTWCITMYIVWQDAQFNSSLIKGGYVMTPVLAAFAMAKAAKRKTGLDEKQLLLANKKELHQELYGDRKTQSTTVEYNFFVRDVEEDGEEEEARVKKRSVKSKFRPSSSEETLK